LVAFQGFTEKPDSADAMDIESGSCDGSDAGAACCTMKARDAIDAPMVGEGE